MSLYEKTLTPNSKEQDQPLLALVAYQARLLWNSVVEFIVFIIISFGVVALVEHASNEHDMDVLNEHDISIGVMGTIGALLTFAITFRLNVCISRWWEGRTLWGKLIYAAINGTQLSCAALKDIKLLNRFTSTVIVFSWACKAQLRDAKLEDEGQEGSKLVARGVMEQAELDHMAKLGAKNYWQPYYCLDVMRSVVNEGLCDHNNSKAYKEYLIDGAITELAQSIGGAIRVKATGMPIGYGNLLKGLLMLYCVAANFAWAPYLHWYTPLVTFAMYFIQWTLLTLGTVLVMPFGVDPVDHPLTKYCQRIELECNAVKQRFKTELHLPTSERAKPIVSPSVQEVDAILRERTPHGQAPGRAVQFAGSA